MIGFDPACEFYLSMPYENLFEQIGYTDGHDFRCKGCRETVKRWKRETHHVRHARHLEREVIRRAERVRAARIERLRNGRRKKG